MDFITSIILGIVEGLTEFIPVSSTGHMILTTKVLGYDDQTPMMKTFEIVIQLGAIIGIHPKQRLEYFFYGDLKRSVGQTEINGCQYKQNSPGKNNRESIIRVTHAEPLPSS